MPVISGSQYPSGHPLAGPTPGSHEYRLEHGQFFPPGYHPYSNPLGHINDGGGASGSAGTVQGATQVVTADPDAALDVAAIDIGLPAAGFGEVGVADTTVVDPNTDLEIDDPEVIDARYGYNPSLQPTVRAQGGYHPGQYGSSLPIPIGYPGGQSMGYPGGQVPLQYVGQSQSSGGGNGGGGYTADPNTATLVNRQYAAPPEDYEHGIQPQWNYYPDAGQGTVSELETVESRYGYNPALPTVRRFLGTRVSDTATPDTASSGEFSGLSGLMGPVIVDYLREHYQAPEQYPDRPAYGPVSVSGGMQTVESRYGYNPALPTVRRFMGGMFDDPDPSMMHVDDNAITRGVGEFLPLDKIMGMLRQMGSEGKMGDAVQKTLELGGGVREDLPIVPMNRGGMVNDAMRLQNAGTGQHNRLVHMTQGEIDAMNQIARSGIGGLRSNGMAINPQTGLPEAGLFSSLLPMIAGLGLTIASGGAASPLMVGLAGAGGSLAGQAIEGEGIDLGRTFLAGLGAWGGAEIGNVLGGAEQVANAAAIPTAAQPAAEIASGTLQSAVPTTISGVGQVPPNVFGSGSNQIIGSTQNLANVGRYMGQTNPAGLAAPNLNTIVTSSVTPSGVSPVSSAVQQAAPTSQWRNLTSGLDKSAKDALMSKHGISAADFGSATYQPSSAAMFDAGQQSFGANANFGDVWAGGSRLDPTQWASSIDASGMPTVGLQDIYKPAAAFGLSAADTFGAFDPPKYDWDDDPLNEYQYAGPYLPRKRKVSTPPVDYQHGIDPQYDYYSYANKGGYVGGLPTIRAQAGYGMNQMAGGRPPQRALDPANVTNALAGLANTGLANTGLANLANTRSPATAQGGSPRPIYSTDASRALRNLAQVRSQPAPVTRQDPLLTGQRPPTLGQMPGQQMFARNGGYASGLPTVRMQDGYTPPPTEGSPSGRFANQIARGDKLLDVRDRNMRPRIVPPQAMSAVGENMAKHAAARRLMGTGVRPSLARLRDVAETPRHAKVLAGAAARVAPFVYPSTPLNVGEKGPLDLEADAKAAAKAAAIAETNRQAEEVMNRPTHGAPYTSTGQPTIGMKEGSRNPMLMREEVPAPRGFTALGRALWNITGHNKGDPSGFMVRETAAQREDQRDIRDLQRERDMEKVTNESWTRAPHRLLKKLRGDTVEKQEGGALFGGPVDVATDGLMQGATPEYQANVAERRDSMLSPSEASLTAEEGRLVEMTILALQDQLDTEAAVEVVNEFVDRFGLDAYRRLEAEVQGDREFGGIIKPAVGDTPPIQGPDKIAGKIVDPVSGQQVANLEVGANEYISTAPDLENEAREAGLPPTPDNGAIAMSTRQNELKAKYGGLMSV